MSDFDWRDVQAIRVSVEWEKRLAAAHSEIERLRESLSIYVHAHRTDNAVPPHIEAAAVKLLGSGSKAAGVEVSE